MKQETTSKTVGAHATYWTDTMKCCKGAFHATSGNMAFRPSLGRLLPPEQFLQLLCMPGTLSFFAIGWICSDLHEKYAECDIFALQMLR